MKRTHKNRIGTVLAAVVLVAALWPIAGGAQAQQPPQDKPQAQEKFRLRDMARDLYNITPEQEKRIQEFRQAQLKASQAFRVEMSKMRTEMRELGKDSKADPAKIDGLIDSMAKLRADHEKIAFRARGEWEKIFTPEQLQKMKKYHGAFLGRPGFAGGRRPGFGRPRMGMSMGPWGMRMGVGSRAAWGWRMSHAARSWRQPFFGRDL
jgi:Spy/CpxP family protein refolding chaperone